MVNTDRQTNILTDRQNERQTERETDRTRDRQTDRTRDKKTDRLTGKQKLKQIDRQEERQTGRSQRKNEWYILSNLIIETVSHFFFLLPQSGGLNRLPLQTQYQLLLSSDTLQVPPLRQGWVRHRFVESKKEDIRFNFHCPVRPLHPIYQRKVSEFISAKIDSLLLSEQSFPFQSLAQMQLYSSPCSIHVPPFLQGLTKLEHGFLSTRSVIKVRVQNAPKTKMKRPYVDKET